MNHIKELSTTIKLIIIFLIILSSFYLFFLSPKLKTIKSIRVELKSMENELHKTKIILKNFELPKEEEKREWEAVQARIDSISAGKKFHELMGELAILSKANHILDASFSTVQNIPSSSPGTTNVKMSDILIKMSFHSQYRDLAYFLKGMNTMALGIVVESLEIKKEIPLIHTELLMRPIRVIGAN